MENKNQEANVLFKKDVIAEEVAVKEFKKFVSKWTFEDKEDYEIKEDYPQALKALRKGLLTFNEEGVPTYNLAFPLNADGENPVKEAIFKTRIKPNTLANITKGLNVQKQQVEYTLRCLSYLSGLSLGELNLIDKFDYKAIEQTATVFF